MSGGTTVVLLNVIAALFALIAAFLWYKSATIQVPHQDEPDESGLHSAAIITRGNTDFLQTAVTQSIWSKRAAIAAALAALFQSAASAGSKHYGLTIRPRVHAPRGMIRRYDLGIL